jgi:hypothetical protein
MLVLDRRHVDVMEKSSGVVASWRVGVHKVVNVCVPFGNNFKHEGDRSTCWRFALKPSYGKIHEMKATVYTDMLESI